MLHLSKSLSIIATVLHLGGQEGATNSLPEINSCQRARRRRSIPKILKRVGEYKC